jgi:hypothetical protein
MRGADLIGAEMHDSRLTQRRAESVKLTLAKVTQLEPVGLGKTKCLPCPHLISI